VSFFQALVLALLQGVTELFPVSSLGHTVILPRLFHWSIDQRDPSFLAFVVLLHVGTATALFIYFWDDWRPIIAAVVRSLIAGRMTGSPAEKLGWRLVAGTAPIVPLGFLLERQVRELFASPRIAAAFLMTSAAAIWLIRVDPLTIARAMRQNATATRAFDLRGVGIVLRRPDLRAAFTGAIAANAAMSASMPTMSLELHHRGHDLGDISVALGSHLVGMYVLAPFSGVLVDRIGRRASLIMGLGVLSLAVTGVLSAGLSVVVPAMFFVGAGWNIAYVASTALVADAAEPEERGFALGSMDLVATLASAAMSAAAPAILSGAGLGMVVSVAVAFAAVPAILLVLSRRRAPVAVGA